MPKTGLLTTGAIALAFGLTACGSSPAPSAQCRSQVAQIAAYEADANSLTADVVSSDVASRFAADVKASGALLKLVAREGCPVTGYAGGVTLR